MTTTISKQTAMDIALAYREVETAEGLLADVKATMAHGHGSTDIRDIFGRVQYGLQLGVPSGKDGHRLFNVPYSLAMPIIEAHIATHRARILALTEKAKAEMAPGDLVEIVKDVVCAYAMNNAEPEEAVKAMAGPIERAAAAIAE